MDASAHADERVEADRLAALRALDLESASPVVYDAAVDAATAIAGTPVGLVSVIDADVQWFKSRRGFPFERTSRSEALCSVAIEQPGRPTIVHDTRRDPRFNDHPSVTGSPHVVFYAGFPLRTDDGYAIGCLCVIDHEPRTLDERQLAALAATARSVEEHLRVAHVDRSLLRDRLRTAALKAREAQRQADELQQARADLIAASSHELRTPLAAITAAAKLLAVATTGLPPDQQLLVEVIRRNGRRLSELVENLLLTADIESGGLHLKRTTTRLRDLIDDVVFLCANRAESAAIELDILLDERAPTIDVDSHLLRHILVSLVRSGIATGHRPGRLAIHAATDTAGVVTITLATAPDPARARDAQTPQGSFISISDHVIERVVAAHGGSVRWTTRDELAITELVIDGRPSHRAAG